MILHSNGRVTRHSAHNANKYDAIDPDNRLVASELERRWNERLTAVQTLEAEMETLSAQRDNVLTATDRQRLMALGKDLPRAWDSLATTSDTRKKIIRTLISEIVVDIVGDSLDLIIHWQGGDHTRAWG